MNPRPSASSPLRSFKTILAALLLTSLALPAIAQAPKSLLPAFGNEGADFTTKAKNGNVVHGWLPNGWNDNTEWAPVSATYTKLTDSPDKDAGAVRIKIEKVEEGGLLQLTTYAGDHQYKKGVHYLVTGWLRSPDEISVKLGARQLKDPYEFYHEQQLSTGKDWKRFEFTFTPTTDVEAIVMFVVESVGTVDLAGVTVAEKP